MAFTKEYQTFEKKLYYYSAGTLTPERIEELFEDLLKVLPNGGKLYKYKSLKSFYVDELEEKYVWFSAAKQLNDEKDCRFNANGFREAESLLKFLLTGDNPRKYLVDSLYREFSQKNPNITPKIIEDCLACVSKNGQKIAKLKFDKFCKEYQLTAEQKKDLEVGCRLYNNEAQNKEAIKNSIGNICKTIETVRDSMQILSLTTAYDKDSLWAYYCGNEGLCIEYDFSKIQSIELKRKFLGTQKVRYGKKKKFRYVDVIKAQMEETQESKAKADDMILSQLLTKEKSWKAEEEWRVIGNMVDNYIGTRIYADIISAIYLDYSIIRRKKARMIIRLAQENNWPIYIRYFDKYEAEYRYDTIENIRKLIRRYRKVE